MESQQNCPESILYIEQALQEEILAIQAAQQIQTESARRWQRFNTARGIDLVSSDTEVKTIKNAVHATIEAAGEALKVGDITPKIDFDDVVAHTLGSSEDFRRASGYSDNYYRDYWRRFSPVSTWEYIKSLFPPQQVEAQAAQHAAKAFKELLRQYRNEAPKISGGRAVIEVPAYSRERYGSNERYYSSLDVRNDILAHADVFITQTQQPPGMAQCFKQMMQAFCDVSKYDFTFNSRDKLTFAEGGQMTFFKECIKVYLPLPLVQDLFVFLAEHGQGN